MTALYVWLLAPAVVLLLSAFILSSTISFLPARWHKHGTIRHLNAPALIGLAGLLFLAFFFAVGQENWGKEVELSAWNFSTENSGAALNLGAGGVNLAFLLTTFLVLLGISLTSLLLTNNSGQGKLLIWGASVYLLFLSANHLSLAYTILLFDLFIALDWLIRKQNNLGVARLFLGILTSSALILTASLTDINNPKWGTLLLGLALWLRLGLYPLVEIAVQQKSRRWKNHNSLAYWVLSLTAGAYLVIQALPDPLPEIWRWLILITMLLNGWLAWRIEPEGMATDNQPGFRPLFHLILAQMLLLLLFAAPLGKNLATAYAIGLGLSVVAVGVMPYLGRPRLSGKSWPYLAPAAATFTLLGLPFSLGWPVGTVVYQIIFSFTNPAVSILAIIAQIFAFSGLARYWLNLWQNDESVSPETHAPVQVVLAGGMVVVIPFLIPGLGPWVLSIILKTQLLPGDFAASITPLIAILVIVTSAAGLGYFRHQVLNWLELPVATVDEFLRLSRLLRWGDTALHWIGKSILRVNVILEGQHYIGWAFFMALVGTIIIILHVTT
ncbi:MAG: hypothetical protein JXM69_13795 [Anaerolineae bacterium]|nr:hypothetical protein [Anaerolineae bacterium]